MSNANPEPNFPRELEILRQLANGLPQIVWVARPDGSHEYYNKKWCEYTGLELAQSTNGSACPAVLEAADRAR